MVSLERWSLRSANGCTIGRPGVKRLRVGVARGAAGRLRRAVDESGVGFLEIAKTPIAVVDVETTGLRSPEDRIVELCVVRMERTATGWSRDVVLSTLVNPGRPMGSSHIHGIEHEHVEAAPSFGGVSRALLSALRGAVVAGWNVQFDVRFLRAEMATAGLACEMPHMCAMRLRHMAGLGPVISLKRACEAHGVALRGHHSAEGDTLATAELVELSIAALMAKGIERYRDLRKLHGYSFTKSFASPLVCGDEALLLPPDEPLLRRVYSGATPATT